MNQEEREFYSKIPDKIKSDYEMHKPNEIIQIHKGEFELRRKAQVTTLTGEIFFKWLPRLDIKFKGKTSENKENISFEKVYDLYIEGLRFGKTSLTTINSSHKIANDEVITTIEGITTGKGIIGDTSIPVTKINFTIPNLRSFFGEPVKTKEQNSYKTSRSRITFENDNYVIKIDKSFSYDELQKSLKNYGGYCNLYSCELTSKKGDLLLSNLNELIHSFSTFLSFLNGRRTSPLFLQGIYDSEIKWTDYSGRKVDQYKYVITWPQKHSIDKLNELWNNFSKLWKDNNAKDVLNTSIHWYVEANSNAGFVEGSIIMAQTCLELMYNWIIIEQKKLIIGQDAENITAANKIRLLMSHLKISTEVPKASSNLKAFIDENSEIVDVIDAIVQIRNAIIHSQEEKRKRLSKINNKVKFEALQVAIWYIELSILYSLSYQGKYYNRCSGAIWSGEGEEIVPFAI